MALGSNGRWAGQPGMVAPQGVWMDALTPQEVDRLLTEGHVAHLAVTDDEGPYVTPLSYVYSGGGIMFRTLEGRRSRALREDSRACIEVMEYDDETGDWASVVAFGTAEFVDDDVAAGAFISSMLHKYAKSFETMFGPPDAPGLAEAYVVRIRLDHVEGRSSGRFLGTKTRPGRL